MKKKILIGVVSVGLLVGGFVYFECISCVFVEEIFDFLNFDGVWECEIVWIWDNKGIVVFCFVIL